MDYTSLPIVKDELHIKGDADDVNIARLVTAASRVLDTLCSGAKKAKDYFLLEDITGEQIDGTVDVRGNVLCWPHKPLITSVSAFEYRSTPVAPWYPVDLVSHPDYVQFPTQGCVEAWAMMNARPNRLMVTISYRGGLATSTDELPEDFVELATLLCGRFYKEAEGNLTDSIGIATIGSIQYTKALPERFMELVKQYKRKTPY